MAVSAIPENYPRIIPYLSVDGADEAIKFYDTVFGAKAGTKMNGPDGKVVHAELEIGNGMVMLADVFPDMGGKSPTELGGSPVTLMIYVEDVDDCFKRAIANGATQTRAVEDQFYGDRSGSFTDPWGHVWYVASHIEDVPPDEMEKRAAQAMGG
jgi:PhnB protein